MSFMRAINDTIVIARDRAATDPGIFMKILFLGDIVGSPGRAIIHDKLSAFKKQKGIDFVIANGENSAGGSGITPSIAEELFSNGVDIITSGDHIWKKKEIYDLLRVSRRIVRPLNYPKGVIGNGYTVVETPSRKKWPL